MVPGTRRMTMNTSVTTPSSVGIADTSRPAMYRRTGPPLFDPALFEAAQHHRRVLVARVAHVPPRGVVVVHVEHPDPVVTVEQDALDLVVHLLPLRGIPGVAAVVEQLVHLGVVDIRVVLPLAVQEAVHRV